MRPAERDNPGVDNCNMVGNELIEAEEVACSPVMPVKSRGCGSGLSACAWLVQSLL